MLEHDKNTSSVRLITTGILALLLPVSISLAEDLVIRSGNLEVRFERATRTVGVSDIELGNVLRNGVIRWDQGDKQLCSNRYSTEASADDQRKEMALKLADDAKVYIKIIDQRQVEVTTQGRATGSVTWTSDAVMGHKPVIGILKDDQQDDNNVLITTLGAPQPVRARAMFDPQRDLAIRVDCEGEVGWRYKDDGEVRLQSSARWKLVSKAPPGKKLLTLNVFRNYYRNDLNIKYYKPIVKRSYWKTAPVLAMTWEGIEGQVGRPEYAQRKEWLYPNIDWVAENMLPYVESMVFQLDDNYPIDDDQYMRDISDYIRAKGLIPGIWLAPFSVVPAAEAKEHPDWFIHKAENELAITFSGLSYDDVRRYVSYILNINNDEVVRNWFSMFCRKISETWNYDYFKIDGIPAILKQYRECIEGNGEEGVRKGLQIVRDVLGPDKYINTSWGIPTPLEGVGIVNGSRCGDDTESMAHVVSTVVVPQNYLNNIVWYSDPDGVSDMYAATVERCRLNFQARALTGQLFVTDDTWVRVPPEISRVWQKLIPSLDIVPANLYPIESGGQYDHFVLHCAKPWGAWNVVGLHNYDNRPTNKSLDLHRLALEADQVHVFDFWNSAYVGQFKSDAKIERQMTGYDGHLFSVVAVDESRPILLSTNRHFSQGGLDLDAVTWQKRGDGWIISGKSSHLVKGDPYELVFAAGAYCAGKATGSGGKIKIKNTQGIVRVGIDPKSSKVEWKINFNLIKTAAAAVQSELINVLPGETASVQIRSIGAKPANWKIRPCDPRIQVSSGGGQLGPWPGAATVTIRAEIPTATWTGYIEIEDNAGSSQRVPVKVCATPPKNLALDAKADGSSNAPEADKIKDGYASAWRSAKKEQEKEIAKEQEQGIWVQLSWDEPVKFSRVVINECTTETVGIKSWKLEAGDDENRQVIASGDKIGKNLNVNLEEPVTAKVLRLVMEKSKEQAGIRELEVY